MSATQRIAVVTGGMGGLGEAICMKLARMGIKVVVTYSPSNTKSAVWLKEMEARDYHFYGYAVERGFRLLWRRRGEDPEGSRADRYPHQ